jgi:hypothetical protein
MVPGSGAVRGAPVCEHKGLVIQKRPLHDSWGSENVGSTDGDREEDSLVKHDVLDRSHLLEALVLAGAHELKGIACAPGSRGCGGGKVGLRPRKEGRL